ncbi:MAG: hypothetical protein AAGJ46_09725 [Planctomycetota bacterium]
MLIRMKKGAGMCAADDVTAVQVETTGVPEDVEHAPRGPAAAAYFGRQVKPRQTEGRGLLAPFSWVEEVVTASQPLCCASDLRFDVRDCGGGRQEPNTIV